MSNRIGRLEFLFWFVASFLGSGILLGIVEGLTHTATRFDQTRLPLSQALCIIAAAVVILKTAVSRFHDVDWPGWAALLMLVPLVDIVALLLLVVVPGQGRPNLYGQPPIFLQRFRKTAKSS
jgi:uncharacterized membrane protein YhaH (DUF805 family)